MVSLSNRIWSPARLVASARPLAGILAVAAFCWATSVQADLAITNGDFENGAGAQLMDVTDWFDAEGGAWWQQTSQDNSPGISPFPGDSTYLFFSGDGGGDRWAYQSIGINDGGLDSISVVFDAGTLDDAGATLERDITVGIYQSDGSYTGGVDGVDIDGAAGVSLIDSFTVPTGPLAPGETIRLFGELDLGTDTTNEMWIRLVNVATEGFSYVGIDNVEFLGDPGAETNRTVVGQDEIVVQGGKQYTLEIGFENWPFPLVLSQASNLVWSSSDTNIATVTQAGGVFAHSPGSVDIIADYDGGPPAMKTVQITARVGLVHRYDFNGPAGSDLGGTPILIEDIEGDADAQLLLGDRIGDGTILLTSDFSAYVDLPNGIISSLGAATFEAFVTPKDLGGAWQRVFTFGIGSNGEVDENNPPGAGIDYVNIVQRQNTLFQFVSDYSIGGNFSTAGAAGPLYQPEQEHHVALVVDPAAGELAVYVDGAPTGIDTGETLFLDQTLDDVNNWLGRSLFGGDSYADAIWNEFRVFKGVLTPLELAANAAYGADVDPLTDPGTPVDSTLALTADATELVEEVGVAYLRATVDYTLVSDVPVNGLSGTVFTSSDTNVAQVSALGVVSAVGAGMADVSVDFMGQMDSVQITVTSIAKPAVLAHRYSFNDAPGTTIISDSVGGANGAVIGPLTYDGSELNFPGNDTSEAPTNGYGNLPNGLISGLGTNAITIETWFTWNGTPGGWQRVWDFGSSNGGEDTATGGATYMFLIPAVGTAGDLRFTVTVAGPGGEMPVYNADGSAPISNEVYVAITYDADDGLGRMYINGVQEGDAVQPSILLTDSAWTDNEYNVWLGRSQFGGDGLFNGSLNELRIWGGILDPEQVMANFVCGPDDLSQDCEVATVSISGAALSGSDLILQWPEAGGDSVLSSTDLVGGEFGDTGMTGTLSNGTYEATIPLGAEAAESFTTGTVD